IVAERRNIDLATVQSIADGRIYTAQQALDLKLIDGINDFGNTISVIIADNDLSGSISLEYFEYEKQQTFLENFLGISSLIDTARSETSAVFKYLDSQVAFPAYYFKF
ncbi:MAG TPA: S49 family peptidase, partial [Treponemataceae bacterium]|nr:S49 family peptidase [Treponemataceae bacterium]